MKGQTSMPSKVSVVGWYGKRNVGDEAFRPAMQHIFEKNTLDFVTPPRLATDPDFVVLGGGAVVAPFYLETLPDCPRYAIGVDIAYLSEIDLMAKYNFKGVLVRNATDLPLMHEKLSCPVEAIPDLAFYIRPSGADILSKYKKFPNKKTIGVMVTDYVNPAIDRSIDQFTARANDFKVKLATELNELINQEYEIILIPCSTGGYGDDRRIGFDLMAFMKNGHQVTNILDTLSPQETIDLIAQLDLAVCMKFHAHIFSIIAATPFVSISFTRKVELLLNENGLNDTTCAKFEGDVFNISDFQAAITRTASQDYKGLYSRLALENYNKLTATFERVRQDWFGESS